MRNSIDEEVLWRRVGNLDYWVSSSGKVRNKDKHIMATVINPVSGYEQIRLVVSCGVAQGFYVHKLVAEAFVPNPNGYDEVNHINEIRIDNRAENLEWCTHKYNCNYGNHNRRVSESQRKGVSHKRIPIWIIFPDNHKEFAHSLREAEEITGWNRGTIQRRLENPSALFDKNTYRFSYVDSSRRTNNKSVPQYEAYELDRTTETLYSEIVARIKKKFPMLKIIGRARGIHNKTNFECLNCGCSFENTPYSVLGSKHGCPICATRIRTEKRRAARQKAEELVADRLYNNLIIEDDYIAMTKPCGFECRSCGKRFTSSLTRLLSHAKRHGYISNGCQSCSKRRAMTIRNLKKYGHSDDDIIRILKERRLDWTLQL